MSNIKLNLLEEQSFTTLTQQRTDLQDSFGEAFDEDYANVTDSLLGQSGSSQQQSRNMTMPTDGVFANMSAKPESDSHNLKEVPPTYEQAAADATPPYWQTTIIAPAGMDDVILVEGLPVGGVFAFFWSLVISVSFQFVGFMLAYLLHTSHASKQGSKAGLGIILIQAGFYIRSENDDDYNNSDVITYLFVILGWLVILRSLADYFRAKRLEKIISVQSTADQLV